MKVWIKSFDVEMQVKQSGIELEVRSPDGKAQVGDCYATMTGLVWCKGKTTKAKGVKLKWEDLATLCTSVKALEAAIKAAKETKE
ncbi:hypothetical protein C7S18_15875 [Ahniella affigens]|uniref:Uncharacterized protein n=1 Tax=Ahniella affigens TaxID=2021234 RepID=A0A2P1PUQ9_9GAMM|nr:hypothetical protein [Ahniella affigens]AVP98574.1 hypothetical protein C7S18_15875 [Ahniella affigens]